MFQRYRCAFRYNCLPRFFSHRYWRRYCGCSTPFGCESAPWLFVGLGNPGQKFIGTRHNVGFEMIDAVSQSEGIKLNMLRHEALVGEGMIAGAPVVLVKPQTYANLCGESVGPLAEYYGIPAQRIVAIFDDMESKVAKLWLLPKGGHGSHRGLMSMIKHLKGSREFPRLRIGIGPPPGQMDPKTFVLQKFCKEEREMMDVALTHGIKVVNLVTTTGIEKAVDAMCSLKKSDREEKENLEFNLKK